MFSLFSIFPIVWIITLKLWIIIVHFFETKITLLAKKYLKYDFSFTSYKRKWPLGLQVCTTQWRYISEATFYTPQHSQPFVQVFAFITSVKNIATTRSNKRSVRFDSPLLLQTRARGNGCQRKKCDYKIAFHSKEWRKFLAVSRNKKTQGGVCRVSQRTTTGILRYFSLSEIKNRVRKKCATQRIYTVPKRKSRSRGLKIHKDIETHCTNVPRM